MDAKPRASADIGLALHSTNEQADALARQMLGRGGRVHVVAFDATRRFPTGVTFGPSAVHSAQILSGQFGGADTSRTTASWRRGLS
jgi:hypothetical protein